MQKIYPVVINFQQLSTIDPEAAAKFVAGAKDFKDFFPNLDVNKVLFALTPNKGWDAKGPGVELLGYMPETKEWTFYEYNQDHGFEIFGKEPIAWVWPDEAGDRVFNRAMELLKHDGYTPGPKHREEIAAMITDLANSR